jgi:hypothetical protein
MLAFLIAWSCNVKQSMLPDTSRAGPRNAGNRAFSAASAPTLDLTRCVGEARRRTSHAERAGRIAPDGGVEAFHQTSDHVGVLVEQLRQDHGIAAVHDRQAANALAAPMDDPPDARRPRVFVRKRCRQRVGSAGLPADRGLSPLMRGLAPCRRNAGCPPEPVERRPARRCGVAMMRLFTAAG